MGGDKKAKIMAQTTKKKIREGPSVLCRVAFDTPNKKKVKTAEGKTGNSFPAFSTIQILFRFKAGLDKRPDAEDLVLSVNT